MFTGLIENLGVIDSFESDRFTLSVLNTSTTSILSTARNLKIASEL